ncbi:MAG: hypothetical protein AAGA25_17590, partial [Planctomycetota bacterium]
MKSPRPPKQAARESYEAKRYPGDLAADLGLSDSYSISPWAWRSLALAASVMIAASALWWLNRTPPAGVEPESNPIVAAPKPAPPRAPGKPPPPPPHGGRRDQLPPQPPTPGNQR